METVAPPVGTTVTGVPSAPPQPAVPTAPVPVPAEPRRRSVGLIAAVVAVSIAVVAAAAAITVVLVRGGGGSAATATRPAAGAPATHHAPSPEAARNGGGTGASSGQNSGQGSGQGSGSQGGTGPGSGGQGNSSQQASPAEQAAAAQIASVLADDVQARSAVVAATQAVGNCSADPNSQAGSLQGAVLTRENDLSRLEGVPTGAIPGGSALVGQLVSAMRASNQADGYYERWMADIEGDTCPYPTTSDSNFQSASGASSQATADKTSFVALWDPLAASLGLPQYDQSQI